MNSFAMFIEENLDSIVNEFEAFALTLSEATAKLSSAELQDHSRIVMKAVARDMASFQSSEAQQAKSKGRTDNTWLSEISETARQHAEHRFQQGFTLPQMVSEYRALRATVVRLWGGQLGAADGKQLDEITRFGEAMDEGLTEAIAWYSKRLEDSRSLLMGVLAHDLRAPLTAVRMSAEYLLRADTFSEGELRAVSRIVSSTGRMAGYVRDLLDFTRTLLGEGLPINREVMDLATLCEAVVDEVRAAHPTATIELKANAGISGTWDEWRLSQLLSNLIVNAVIHGDAAHPVTVTATSGDQLATVRVHNWGGAIPADALPTLFQPLMQRGSTLRRPAGSSGLGLGLYICKQIALAHGGDLQVHSDSEAGTTFAAQISLKPRHV